MNTMTTVLAALLVPALSHGAGRAESVSVDAKPVANESSVTAGVHLNNAKTASTKSEPGTTGLSKPISRADTLSGSVQEVISGGGYTYFHLEQGGEKFWVAVPPTEGKIGDEMSFQPGIEMRSFKSKSLDRTFDRIFFSGGKSLPAGSAQKDDFMMKKAHDMKPAVGAGATDTKAAPSPESLTGKVVEKLDAGGYSYFLLEKDGKRTWIAAPPTDGKVGDTISFQPGMEMKAFKSKALNRTFDTIIFTGGVVSGDAKPEPEQKKQSH